MWSRTACAIETWSIGASVRSCGYVDGAGRINRTARRKDDTTVVIGGGRCRRRGSGAASASDVDEFRRGFETMKSGERRKVFLDWKVFRQSPPGEGGIPPEPI